MKFKGRSSAGSAWPVDGTGTEAVRSTRIMAGYAGPSLAQNAAKGSGEFMPRPWEIVSCVISSRPWFSKECPEQP